MTPTDNSISKHDIEIWIEYMRRFSCIYMQSLANLPVSRNEFEVLICIRELEKKQKDPSPTAICNLLLCSRQTMTSILDKLEGQDLIRRTPHSNDRRRLRLDLTKKGAGILDHFRAKLITHHLSVIKGVTHEDFCHLFQTLDKIQSAIRFSAT